MLRLRRALQEAPDGQGGCLADAADFKREAAALEVRLAGLQALEARCAAERSAGRNPGAKAQMLEVRSAELCLAVMEMLVEAAGYYALASADSLLLHNEGPVGPPTPRPLYRVCLPPKPNSARTALSTPHGGGLSPSCLASLHSGRTLGRSCGLRSHSATMLKLKVAR